MKRVIIAAQSTSAMSEHALFKEIVSRVALSHDEFDAVAPYFTH